MGGRPPDEEEQSLEYEFSHGEYGEEDSVRCYRGRKVTPKKRNKERAVGAGGSKSRMAMKQPRCKFRGDVWFPPGLSSLRRLLR